MFLRLARRSAITPSFARASSDRGSIPFWLITTNVFLFSGVHTFLLSSRIFCTLEKKY